MLDAYTGPQRGAARVFGRQSLDGRIGVV